MSLKFTVESLDDVKEELRALYTEKDGKYELDVTGLPEAKPSKTDEDVKRLKDSLEAEREEHKATKKKLRAYDDLGSADEIRDKFDELDDLKTSGANGNEELINTKRQLRAAEKERDTYKTQFDGQKEQLDKLLKLEKSTKIRAKINEIIEELPSKYDRTKMRLMMDDEADRFELDELGELAQYKGHDVKDWMINRGDLFNLTVPSQPGDSQPGGGRKPEPKGDIFSQMAGELK